VKARGGSSVHHRRFLDVLGDGLEEPIISQVQKGMVKLG